MNSALRIESTGHGRAMRLAAALSTAAVLAGCASSPAQQERQAGEYRRAISACLTGRGYSVR